MPSTGKSPGIYLTQLPLWLVIAGTVATLDIGQKILNGIPIIKVNVEQKSPFFR